MAVTAMQGTGNRIEINQTSTASEKRDYNKIRNAIFGVVWCGLNNPYMSNNLNVGKCGHAKCAGGNGCLETGKPMRAYRKAMLIKDVNEIKSEDEARQYAIDWQNWQSEEALSYGELAEWHVVFTELAEKFKLEEEFKENGII